MEYKPLRHSVLITTHFSFVEFSRLNVDPTYWKPTNTFQSTNDHYCGSQNNETLDRVQPPNKVCLQFQYLQSQFKFFLLPAIFPVLDSNIKTRLNRDRCIPGLRCLHVHKCTEWTISGETRTGRRNKNRQMNKFELVRTSHFSEVSVIKF